MAYSQALQSIANSAKLYFPEDEAIICLLTDASDYGWSIILTQVRNWKEGSTVEEQAHELLICQGGVFRGAQMHWSVVEKEAYPVVRACISLDYILEREGGFKAFCDHSNLIQIFSPSEDVKKHTRGKLLRWALRISCLRYTIEHIDGERNLWADIVSRWTPNGPAPQPKTVRDKAARVVSTTKLSRLRPMQDEHFEWPTLESIKESQATADNPGPGFEQDEHGVWVSDGKIWLPSSDESLIMHVMIIAHCDTRAHRGADAMLQLLSDEFEVEDLRARVDKFVADCLLCKHVKGGLLIQRPWNSTHTATRRNEPLHMDFLSMGESYGESQYLFVLKDDLSHYCELVACESDDGLVAATAGLDWYKRFGLPETWMSDNGSHFRNALMSDLKSRLGAEQRFAPVYLPWLNGTVERLNRDILQVVRVLLLEFQLDSRNWEYLLPVVQSNLNQTPVRSLMGKSPLEFFTGLDREPIINVVLKPRAGSATHDVVRGEIQHFGNQLDALRSSLHELHAEVVDAKEQRRLRQQAAKRGRECTFSVGDFVLWSRADPRMSGQKLMVRWVGPFRIARELPTSFMIEHLLTGEQFDVHAIRLKHYADRTLDVTEELKHHVALQGIKLGVRAVLNGRRNRRAKEWQLLVSWHGLEDSENSWEAFNGIYAAVPDMVTEYVDNCADDSITKYLKNLQEDIDV